MRTSPNCFSRTCASEAGTVISASLFSASKSATNTEETRAEMKRILDDIQSGRFTRNWMLENKVNQASFKAMRKKMSEHPIEEIGVKLRGMMPWIKERALVDRTRN